MLYVHCDTTNKKVASVHSAATAPPVGQVEVEITDGHDVVNTRYAWKLNATQDDLEEDLLSIKVRYIGVLYDEFGKMVEHRYPLDAKLALIYLHDEGSENGWAVNRVPYVQGFFSWINGVMTSMYGKKNEILALATRADVESFDWTVAMEAEEALDPLVDVETALGYTD